jgi:indole-3-acetate monooxygenase
MTTSNLSGAEASRPLSASEIYANARELGSYLKEKSDEIEEARRLPPEVVERMREAGMFRLAMPKAWGGPELSTIEQVEVIEELSKANTSAGWCVMIGCDSGFLTGYLEDRVARQLMPRLDTISAGNVFPTGRADRVEGGYKISGQWPFGSGITHADIGQATCIVFENGAPMMNGGVPISRRMVAPESAYEIVDNWYTTGCAEPAVMTSVPKIYSFLKSIRSAFSNPPSAMVYFGGGRRPLFPRCRESRLVQRER